ncbi:hypothetical protein [uncultured Litoreibacter sp.]|uniref:hypothetical protein n=1 Tax=uncultured Litoreibacter sp. TaxID=1392394 RepID=UPI00262BD380|nr:hypothetical protein [uncultured Litoreibacter sp.]
MDHIALFEAHRQFFDIKHIGRQNLALANASVAEVAEILLDPKNPTPPAPNQIFDPAHYELQRHPIEPADPINPLVHYLTKGGDVRLSPNALFDVAFYKRTIKRPDLSPYATLIHALDHIDTGLTGFSPFVDLDYLREETKHKNDGLLLRDLFSGDLQPTRPHPLFDLEYFSLQSGTEFETLADAVRHYWSAAQDLSTHPLFDVAFYKSHFPEQSGICRSVYHYLISVEPQSPHPLFDGAFYSGQVAAEEHVTPIRPLEHFLAKGQAMGLSPSPYFDVAYYQGQSQCGSDAVQYYLEGGHRNHSPHPMIDATQAQLFAHSLESAHIPVAELLADETHAPPLDLTPDFVPEYFAKMVPDVGRDPQKLRRRYLRDGYPTGQRPNGLLSMPYIASQCRWLDIEGRTPLSGYFEAGLHRRPRFILALGSLKHNATNESWLAFLKSQIGNPEIEFVVVSAQPGPMSPAFFEVAHVWHLAKVPLSELGPNDLKRAGDQFARSLLSNPATICFAEYSGELTLVRALTGLGAPLILFGKDRLAQLTEQEADILTKTCTHVFCTSPRTRDDLAAIFAETGPSVSDGFHTIIPTVKSSAGGRLRARSKLGLSEETRLVVSSGGPEIEHGADLFGALAARCFEDKAFLNEAVFHWYCPDTPYGNRPKFYGRLIAETTEERNRFQLMDGSEMATAIAAADVYVKLGRDECPLDDVKHARNEGVPVLLMDGPAEAVTLASQDGVLLVDAFDLDAARRLLHDLLTGSVGANPPRAAPDGASAAGYSLTAFSDRITKLLSATAPELKLSRPSRSAMTQLLMVMPDKDMFERLSALTEKHDPIEDTAALWFDLPQIRRDEFPDGLRELFEEQDCSELVVVGSADGLSEHLINDFTRSVWLLDGTASELSSLYRKGLEFDALLTRETGQISEMRDLNAVIADTMVARDWRA